MSTPTAAVLPGANAKTRIEEAAIPNKEKQTALSDYTELLKANPELINTEAYRQLVKDHARYKKVFLESQQERKVSMSTADQNKAVESLKKQITELNGEKKRLESELSAEKVTAEKLKADGKTLRDQIEQNKEQVAKIVNINQQIFNHDANVNYDKLKRESENLSSLLAAKLGFERAAPIKREEKDPSNELKSLVNKLQSLHDDSTALLAKIKNELNPIGFKSLSMDPFYNCMSMMTNVFIKWKDCENKARQMFNSACQEYLNDSQPALNAEALKAVAAIFKKPVYEISGKQQEFNRNTQELIENATQLFRLWNSTTHQLLNSVTRMEAYSSSLSAITDEDAVDALQKQKEHLEKGFIVDSMREAHWPHLKDYYSKILQYLRDEAQTLNNLLYTWRDDKTNKIKAGQLKQKTNTWDNYMDELNATRKSATIIYNYIAKQTKECRSELSAIIEYLEKQVQEITPTAPQTDAQIEDSAKILVMSKADYLEKHYLPTQTLIKELTEQKTELKRLLEICSSPFYKFTKETGHTGAYFEVSYLHNVHAGIKGTLWSWDPGVLYGGGSSGKSYWDETVGKNAGVFNPFSDEQ